MKLINILNTVFDLRVHLKYDNEQLCVLKSTVCASKHLLYLNGMV